MFTKRLTSCVTTVWSINTICIIETSTATMAFQREILQYAKAADSLFGGGGKYRRIIIADEPYDMYERICQVIKDKTTAVKEGEQQITIEYFEAVRIVYLKDTQYFIEYFGCDDDGDICYDRNVVITVN
jgi:hypothetical protein